jgi:hypothetical protein
MRRSFRQRSFRVSAHGNALHVRKLPVSLSHRADRSSYLEDASRPACGVGIKLPKPGPAWTTFNDGHSRTILAVGSRRLVDFRRCAGFWPPEQSTASGRSSSRQGTDDEGLTGRNVFRARGICSTNCASAHGHTCSRCTLAKKAPSHSARGIEGNCSR